MDRLPKTRTPNELTFCPARLSDELRVYVAALNERDLRMRVDFLVAGGAHRVGILPLAQVAHLGRDFILVRTDAPRSPFTMTGMDASLAASPRRGW